MFLAAIAAFAAEPMAVGKMRKVGEVSPRFQSYNVEMVEVTGGRFWAPYKKAEEAKAAAKAPANSGTPGIDPSLFLIRRPIDLSSPRLRKLAAALGPAYVRVSGTWANSTYFHNESGPAPASPPSGFGGVLTQEQWRGVVEFSKAVDAPIVTSFSIGPGTRDDSGIWTPAQAKSWLAYTKQIGGKIAAAEFFNEPTFAAMGGAPKGYNANIYGEDFRRFRKFLRAESPETILLGPGSVGEVGFQAALEVISSESLLTASGPGLDAFSYHFYGGVSQRCKAFGPALQTTPEAALSEAWLARTDKDAAFYAEMRDRFEPGKPLWLTETGETACGGNPWAATYADTFRYLDQLGRLARKGVQVVMHNTLAASDYALIDEETLTPRPSYWGALLWSRLMGTTVLDPGPSPDPSIHLYAHCLKSEPGGVALLAIHTDRGQSHKVNVPAGSRHYALASATGLVSSTVELNGKRLEMGAQDQLPAIQPAKAEGEITLAPATIHFFAMRGANNPACR